VPPSLAGMFSGCRTPEARNVLAELPHAVLLEERREHAAEPGEGALDAGGAPGGAGPPVLLFVVLGLQRARHGGRGEGVDGHRAGLREHGVVARSRGVHRLEHEGRGEPAHVEGEGSFAVRLGGLLLRRHRGVPQDDGVDGLLGRRDARHRRAGAGSRAAAAAGQRECQRGPAREQGVGWRFSSSLLGC
jgi:hypothetical protein